MSDLIDSDAYIALSADEKLGLLWQQLRVAYEDVADRPVLKPAKEMTDEELAEVTPFTDPRVTAGAFGRKSGSPHIVLPRLDVLQPGRRKLIHLLGTCAKIEWLPARSGEFSGLFASGARGIIRISDGRLTADGPWAPGVAIKLFIDRQPSADLLFGHAFDGAPDLGHFLSFRQSTTLPEPTTENGRRVDSALEGALREIAEGAAGEPRVTGTHPVALFRRDGTAESQPSWPTSIDLRLTPAFDAHFKEQVERQHPDFRDLCASLPSELVGQPMYDVVLGETASMASPGAQVHSPVIAKVVLKTPFVALAFSDHQLIFRHPLPRQ